MKQETYPDIDMEKTGELIRKKICAAGLTVKYIQEKLYLSCPQPVYRWFKGQILPSVNHLYVLSRLLGVHMEELLVQKADVRIEGPKLQRTDRQMEDLQIQKTDMRTESLQMKMEDLQMEGLQMQKADVQIEGLQMQKTDMQTESLQMQKADVQMEELQVQKKDSNVIDIRSLTGQKRRLFAYWNALQQTA